MDRSVPPGEIQGELTPPCSKSYAQRALAAALLAEGIIINRYTAKRHEPRGLFCGIGQCTDCMMTVNGVPNIRTCITPVEDGMTVETQDGLGEWRVDQ